MKNTNSDLLLAYLLLLLLAIIKSLVGYYLFVDYYTDAEGIIKAFAVFDILISTFMVVIYFLFSSFLTYSIAEIIVINSRFKIDFSEFISVWFIALVPMMIVSFLTLFFVDNISNYKNEINIVNTSTEVLFLIWGTLLLTKKYKIKIYSSVIAVITPILVFQIFKHFIS
jgi:hypothetical protein